MGVVALTGPYQVITPAPTATLPLEAATVPVSSVALVGRVSVRRAEANNWPGSTKLTVYVSAPPGLTCRGVTRLLEFVNVPDRLAPVRPRLPRPVGHSSRALA